MPPQCCPEVTENDNIQKTNLAKRHARNPSKGQVVCRTQMHHKVLHTHVGNAVYGSQQANILAGTLLLTSARDPKTTNQLAITHEGKARKKKKQESAQILDNWVIHIALFRPMICWRPPPSHRSL